MTTIRSQNAVLLVKLQSAEGEDVTPDAATDAILIETDGLAPTIGNRLIESTEATASLDVGAPAPVGAPSTFAFRARLRGAGQAYTGSVRPPLHPVLRACAMKDTLYAAISAAAASAGSATSATLGTGYSTTEQDYRGCVLTISGGDHANKATTVTDYTTGKVATLTDTFDPAISTDSFALPAQVVYKPVSDRADIPWATVWLYQDGLLYKFKDCQGTGQFAGQAGNPLSASFTMTGQFVSLTDASVPTTAAPVSVAAPLFAQESRLYEALLLDRSGIAAANFQFDLGANVQSPEDPNTQNGFGSGFLVSRDMRVTVDPLMNLVAERNTISALQQGTLYTGAARVGNTAGNRIAFTFPSLQVVERGEGDRTSLKTENLTLKANGANAGGFIAFW